MSENLVSQTYSFSAAYQTKLLRIVSTSKEFLQSHRALLEPHYFDDDIMQDISRLMFDYYDEYKDVPTIDAMREAVADLVKDDKRKKKLSFAYDKALDAIATATLEEKDDIVKRVVNFAQESAAAAAIMQSLSDLERGDRSHILQRMKDALSVGADVDDLGLVYFEDKTRFSWSRNLDCIGTGLSELDKLLDGGLALAEHGTVAAPTGGFKSGTLVNLAASAVDQGCQVVYITLELADVAVAKRIDKRLSNRFSNLPPEIVRSEAFLEKLQEYQRRVRGNLVVKKFPSGTTASQIRAFLNMLKEKGMFCRRDKKSMLIVDYPKLMKAEGRFEKDTSAIESCYNAITEIAEEFNCAAWSAMQVTRAASARLKTGNGRSAGAKIIHKEDLAECFAVAHGVSIILSVNQDFDEQQQNLGRVFLAKVREAEDGRTINVKIDKANMLITENTIAQARARRIDARQVDEILETSREARDHAN